MKFEVIHSSPTLQSLVCPEKQCSKDVEVMCYKIFIYSLGVREQHVCKIIKIYELFIKILSQFLLEVHEKLLYAGFAK